MKFSSEQRQAIELRGQLAGILARLHKPPQHYSNSLARGELNDILYRYETRCSPHLHTALEEFATDALLSLCDRSRVDPATGRYKVRKAVLDWTGVWDEDAPYELDWRSREFMLFADAVTDIGSLRGFSRRHLDDISRVPFRAWDSDASIVHVCLFWANEPDPGPARDKLLNAVLQAGFDPDTQFPDTRQTPLMLAAMRADANAMRMLLAHGADPKRRDSRNWTAWSYLKGSQNARRGTCEAMLQAGGARAALTAAAEAALSQD